MSGSYSADAIYQQIKDLDTQTISDQLDRFLQMLSPGLVEKSGLRRVDEYDVKQAFYDLQTTVREDFNRENSDMLSELGVPFFSITGSTTPLEAPSFQFADTVKMSQYDANNDMQLTQKQATMDIPIATHLAMLHGHHWDIAYSPFPARMQAMSPNLDHPSPVRRRWRPRGSSWGTGPDRLTFRCRRADGRWPMADRPSAAGCSAGVWADGLARWLAG